MFVCLFFFFKQKTAYEMRISDWSSDVCSSDLGDAGLIDRLRAMINFGFQGQRSATVPGLNAKLPEVLALMARAKLEEIEAVCESRAAVEAAYREALGDRFILQAPLGTRRAIQRSEEHTSELQSLMRISYAVFCLKK